MDEIERKRERGREHCRLYRLRHPDANARNLARRREREHRQFLALFDRGPIRKVERVPGQTPRRAGYAAWAGGMVF